MVEAITEDVMFSVEVTTYNQREYIAQTLQSIIDQEHNYKYEILVSDDCSTDGTQGIIKQFYEKYPKIIKPVFNQKNLGPMKNYYATIARATGKYMMGCGGDDYWLPGKVAKQIDFMERNLDFDVCYGTSDIVYEKENRIEHGFGSNYLDFKDILKQRRNSCPALTLCVRRSFLLKYLDEIKPQQRDWMVEDYPFLIYAAYESLIYFLNMTMAVYRVIDNSVSHQVDTDKLLRYKKSTYDVEAFFSNRYSIPIEEWDEKKKLKEVLAKRKNKKDPFRLLKRIIKCFIPYGIIKLSMKLKDSTK